MVLCNLQWNDNLKTQRIETKITEENKTKKNKQKRQFCQLQHKLSKDNIINGSFSK